MNTTRSASCYLLTMCISVALNSSALAADEFNGNADIDIKYTGSEIKLVDGKGNRILTGNGQNLVIKEKKDGEGSLTLRNFGNVTIQEKNGDGKLIVENCASITIEKMNGKGSAYLRLKGTKTIGNKNGAGNIYFMGDKPAVGKLDGDGKVIKEN